MPTVKVVKKLWIRRDASTLNRPIGVLNIGTVLEVEGPIKGKPVPGTSNDFWYKDSKGYYWSGGVKVVNNSNYQNYTEAESDINIIDKAKNYYENQWKKEFPNVVGVGVGLKNHSETGEVSLIVRVDKKIRGLSNAFSIPETVSYKGITFKTDVIETRDARKLVDPDVPIRTGSSIYRDNPLDWGSIGLIFPHKDKAFMLSCFHVVCAPELLNAIKEFDFRDSRINDNKKLIFTPKDKKKGKNIIGEVLYGRLTQGDDSALVKILPSFKDSNAFETPVSINDLRLRFVNSKDVDYGISLWCWSYNRIYKDGKISYGVLVEDKQTIPINYDPPIGWVHMQNLLVAKMNVLPGDSGSVVTDERGNVVGMLIGGGNLNSNKTLYREAYIIPIGMYFKPIKNKSDGKTIYSISDCECLWFAKFPS